MTSFDTLYDNGVVIGQELCWCGGVVIKICDGTWLKPNGCTRCYNENEAAEINWDAMPESKPKACTGIVELSEKKWNKDCDGAWRRDLGEESYCL